MRTILNRARQWAFAVGLVVALVPVEAQAQSAHELATARELYKQGKDLRANGDLAGAFDKFKAAHATAATPITALELGRAHLELGRLVEAREVFLSVARLKTESDESEKSASARREAADFAEQVKPRIPTVTIRLVGLPPEASAKVTLDGAEVPAVAVGAPRVVNPGKHVAIAKAGEGKEVSQTVELKEGETQEIRLSPVWVAPKEKDSLLPEDRRTKDEPVEKRGTSPLVWIGFGVGAAGAIAGTVTAVLANAKASTLKNDCPDPLSCDARFRDEVTAAQRDGKTLRTLSIVSFAVGGIGLGLGVVGILMSGGEKKRTGGIEPWLGLGTAGVRGAF